MPPAHHVPTDAETVHWIAGANPASIPLPSGLTADPTYLAFMRGMGFSYSQAQATALQNIAAARAQYATTQQRLPEQLQAGEKGVNDTLGDRGLWNSGERLDKISKELKADQERHVDASQVQAGAVSAAQQALSHSISDLARQQADQVGELQDRHRQQTNQDRYIAAVRSSSGGGGGGGGVTFSIPAPPGPPGAAGAGNPFPQMQAGQRRTDYFHGLSGPQQMQFAAFLHGTTHGSTDPQSTLNAWLAADPGMVGPRPAGSTAPGSRY